MPDERTRSRAQFLLASMLWEAKHALIQLEHVRPRIFARGISKIILNTHRLAEIRAGLEEAIPSVRSGSAIDWDAIQDVGLTGDMLELKADLFYAALGRPKPERAQQQLFDDGPDILSYPEGKPVWSRLFKLPRSLLGSLTQGLKQDSRIRLILDMVKEFIECTEASLKFIQTGGGT